MYVSVVILLGIGGRGACNRDLTGEKEMLVISLIEEGVKVNH